MDEEYRSGLWRKEAATAGRVTVGYVLSGTLWFMLLSVLGCLGGSEAPAELLWLVVPISAIAVYPSSFVLAGTLSALLPLKVEWRRPWRAWLSGVLAAPLLFSPFGGWIVEKARQMAGDGNLMLDILAVLGPIHLMLALGLAVTWALPPWHWSRSRQGGADGRRD